MDGGHVQTLGGDSLAINPNWRQYLEMASIPLSEIISAVQQLQNEYGTNRKPWLNPRLDTKDIDVSRIRRITGPENFDSGPIKSGIPIYSDKDQEKSGQVPTNVSLEILAWYVSFHENLNLWGIYLSRKGIYSLANSLVSAGVTKGKSISLAKMFLVRHEQAHFQTDLGITSIELAQSRPIYLHARHKAGKENPPWNLKEEGLSNALARRSLKSERDKIDNFLNSSPLGYRDWAMYKASQDASNWQEVIKELSSPISAVIGWSLAAETSNLIATKYFDEIPIYEVDDIFESELGDSNFLGPITEIIETPDFQKDMKKLLRGQPSYKKKWENTKRKLAAGNTVGVHLELINKKESIHSVQIDGEARAGIQKLDNWFAIAAGHHEDVYRRLNSK
jgi:hypothetical protein